MSPTTPGINPSDPPLPTTENVCEADGVSTAENNPADMRVMSGSSAANFMERIRELIDKRVGVLPQSALHKPSECVSPPSRPWMWDQCAQQNSRAEGFVLPSRTTADSLLDTYWTEVHTLYPLLHRPSFNQEYRKVWLGEILTGEEQTFHCMLNTIFALGCQLNNKMKPEQKETNANVYFQRAIGLLRLDFLGPGSFHLVQALLLMGQYLQSTNTPHRCWVLVGLAIRIAQDLGLDLPQSSQCLEIQRDQEIARRIWHGCVMMDR
jgi:hypothetical protein